MPLTVRQQEHGKLGQIALEARSQGDVDAGAQLAFSVFKDSSREDGSAAHIRMGFLSSMIQTCQQSLPEVCHLGDSGSYQVESQNELCQQSTQITQLPEISPGEGTPAGPEGLLNHAGRNKSTVFET